jgi:restriction endonuclease S subunit
MHKIYSASYPVQIIQNISNDIFSGSTPLAKGNAYVEPPNGIRFLRSGEITEDGEVTSTSEIHITEEIHNGLLRRSQLNFGDVLIAIVGATIGNVGVYESNEPSSINQAIAVVRLRNQEILPKYLCYYLKSGIGQGLLDFFKRPVARANINLEEISEIPVLIPPYIIQSDLVSSMDEARSQRKQKLAEADALLSSLDDYLLKTLGLEPPVKDDRKVFAIQISSISGRFDPHFHAPNFKNIYRLLSKTTTKKLGEIVQFSKDSWNPKDEEKLTFRYIEISNVKPQTGEAIWTETLTKEAPSRARMLVHGDDIIVSLTRPHHGSIAHLSEEFDGCIASTGFAVIRSVSKLVNREYLWCILRSQLSLQQMLQRSSGGNYPAITKTELENIIIPIHEISIQEQIVAEIQRRRSESQRLRSEAESGWQAAKQWFEDQLLGGS